MEFVVFGGFLMLSGAVVMAGALCSGQTDIIGNFVIYSLIAVVIGIILCLYGLALKKAHEEDEEEEEKTEKAKFYLEKDHFVENIFDTQDKEQ